MAHTFTIDDVPATLSAWDRIVHSAARQNAENEEHDTAVAEEERRLAEAMEDALSEGDVRAPAFFAVPKGSKRGPLPLFEEFYGSVDQDHLRAEWLQLVIDANLGMNIMERAGRLLEAVSARFAHNEAGIVIGPQEVDVVAAAREAGL